MAWYFLVYEGKFYIYIKINNIIIIYTHRYWNPHVYIYNLYMYNVYIYPIYMCVYIIYTYMYK